MVRNGTWVVMTLLAVLVAAYAFVSIAVPGLRTPFVVDLFSNSALRTAGHLGAGGIAIIAGALQFNTRLRFESPRIHRRVGMVYLVAVLIGGTAGLFLAPSSTGGLPGHYGFGLLAVLWVTTAGVAWRQARSGEYAAHRVWMIRSYSLCLAAVTLRLYIPLSAVFGLPFEAAYPAIAWLSWVPNLIVAEWFVIPGRLAPLEPAG